MINPKETFLNSVYRQPFENITASPAFQCACDYALLELLTQLPPTVDPLCDNHSQMVGARKVIDILQNLHKLEPEGKPVTSASLNYNVR